MDGPKKDDALEILLEHHSTNSNEKIMLCIMVSLGDESNHFLWSLSKDLEKRDSHDPYILNHTHSHSLDVKAKRQNPRDSRGNKYTEDGKIVSQINSNLYKIRFNDGFIENVHKQNITLLPHTHNHDIKAMAKKSSTKNNPSPNYLLPENRSYFTYKAVCPWPPCDPMTFIILKDKLTVRMMDINPLIDGGFVNQSIKVKGSNDARKGLFVKYFEDKKMSEVKEVRDLSENNMTYASYDSEIVPPDYTYSQQFLNVKEGFANPEEKDLTYKDDFKNLIKPKSSTSTNPDTEAQIQGGGINVMDTVSSAGNVIGKTVRQLLANPVAFTALRFLTFILAFYIAFFSLSIFMENIV